MQFSALEIIAGLMIVLAMLKIVILYTKPEIWLGSVKKLYTHPHISSPIALLLASVVLFFLMNAGIRIVDILVVALFVGLLIMAGLAPFGHDVFAWMEKQDIGVLLKKMWLYTLVWMVLLIWGAVEILRTSTL